MAAAPRRRWRWLAAGALLMAMGGTLGAWASVQGDERVPVVAAARDLPAGHVLTDADLRVVSLAGGRSLPLVDARATDLTGRKVAVPVRAGTPLTQSAVGAAAAFPPPGQAVVAAEVAAGVLPASAVEGSSVAVIITGTAQATGSSPESLPPSPQASAGSDSDGEESEAAAPAPDPVPGRAIEARVHSIEATEKAAGGGPVVVELVVQAQDAEAVAQAASAEQLRLAVIPGAGDR